MAELTALGFTLTSFPINIFDLGYDDIDGLLGMNLLSDFNYESDRLNAAFSSREITPGRRSSASDDEVPAPIKT